MTDSPSQILETGALDHPNVQLVRNYQAAMARGDFAAGAIVFAPDVVYTVPGHNRLSGTFHGPEPVMGYLGKLMDITGGTYRISEMKWLVSDDGKVALVTRNHAQIEDRTLAWDEVLVFEIHAGKKTRIDMFQANQAAVDEFYGN